MRAYLIRVGVDQAFGGWNSPIDPSSNAFVYVPIPEKTGTPFQPGLAKSYEPFSAALAAFPTAPILPESFANLNPHLDPDFENLSYGDNGLRRGKGMCDLVEDDLVVFFAGMRPITKCEHKLVYALIGLYRVREVARLRDIPPERWGENAHTRKLKQGPDDVIIRAKPGVSGRLERAIPIGEFRDRAYRVRRDLLSNWGDLSCRDGFIQRSAVPPTFNDPARFLSWFEAQSPQFMAANNPGVSTSPTAKVLAAPPRTTPPVPIAVERPVFKNDQPAPVILVHLRQPKRSDPNESRTDPLYEFGCFGLTDCHNTNLLRDTSATGARFGFIQPGPKAMRLVFLTPPVVVHDHGKRRAAHWKPAEMPLKYKLSILLIDQDGNADVPGIKSMIEGGQRSTWVGRFSSAFRSRTTPLPDHIAAELVAVWDAILSTGGSEVQAQRYWEALPYSPPKPDTHREATHQRLLSIARGEPPPQATDQAPKVDSLPTKSKKRGCCR